ncbi:NUDIX domain-containing protein [Cytobacillus gottheilii]|uniref:NUDIX domain-containing protein n=1 Tax=Cytobacillus gottheilii TaxID=859144 RepID=UPI002494A216|nr:NUDIX domain-containing protein [Cytobacillus gottheilii]
MARVDYYYDGHAPVPNSIVPAVSAVILSEDGNKILLQERVDNGKWSLPGGQVDPGESVEEAVKREVSEETGIDIEVLKMIGVYSDPNHVISYSDGEIRQQFSICFLCKALTSELAVSHESKRVSYLLLDQLHTLNMHITQKIRIEDALKNQAEAFIR